MSLSNYVPIWNWTNEFIGPIRTYEFHFMSGAPQTKNKSLAFIRPLDIYVWTFILVSILAVSLALIIVNKVYATWSKAPPKDTPLQSM